MAQKKITDLTLRTDFDATVNLAGDDTAQTWRVTGAQVLAYVRTAIDPDIALGDRNYNPSVQKFLASATYNRSYWFNITAGNATSGATYTNNGVTYTVVETVAAGTRVLLRGNGLPSASGTLTKSAGTGDSTLTFSSYRAPIYVDVVCTGGGGGGGGCAATSGSQIAASGGGGGGGTAMKKIQIASLGLTETVTVGAGGAGGTAGVVGGTTGGTSSFGSHCTGIGGAGGAGGSTTSTGTIFDFVMGGNGGASTGGDIEVNGGCGGTASCMSGISSHANHGGLSHWSGPARSSASVSATGSASGYGSGSAGSQNGVSQSARAGGDGAGGVIVVTEHFQ